MAGGAMPIIKKHIAMKYLPRCYLARAEPCRSEAWSFQIGSVLADRQRALMHFYLANRFAHIGVIVAEIDGGHAVGVAGIGLAMRPAINDELVVGMHDGDRRFSDLRAAGVEHDQIGRAEALPGYDHELIVS